MGWCLCARFFKFFHFFTLILYYDKIAITIVMIAIDAVIHFHLFVSLSQEMWFYNQIFAVLIFSLVFLSAQSKRKYKHKKKDVVSNGGSVRIFCPMLKHQLGILVPRGRDRLVKDSNGTWPLGTRNL